MDMAYVPPAKERTDQMDKTATASSVEIVCGHCARVNRVGADRPAEAARCGACHQKLFEGQPIDANEAAFDTHVSRNGIPVLVDVWAPWCAPCRQMAPHFERAATLLEPNVRLLKINADHSPRISVQFNIRGIPALLLFRGGKLIAQNAGAMDATRIVNWTQSQLGRMPS